MWPQVYVPHFSFPVIFREGSMECMGCRECQATDHTNAPCMVPVWCEFLWRLSSHAFALVFLQLKPVLQCLANKRGASVVWGSGAAVSILWMTSKSQKMIHHHGIPITYVGKIWSTNNETSCRSGCEVTHSQVTPSFGNWWQQCGSETLSRSNHWTVWVVSPLSAFDKRTRHRGSCAGLHEWNLSRSSVSMTARRSWFVGICKNPLSPFWVSSSFL